jgi:general secretion pathway protein K
MAFVAARLVRAAGGRERGFALLIVLWTLGLLSLLAAQVTSGARTETRLAANLRGAAIAAAAADGAVMETAYRLRIGAWAPDGVVRPLAVGEVRVAVRATDERGLVNPNRATVPLLRALLRQVGVPTSRADQLATAIVDFRLRGPTSLMGGLKITPYRAAGLDYGPTGRPFGDVEGLAVVLGMRPDILARIDPFLSVDTDNAVTPALASGPVRAAIAELEDVAARTGQPVQGLPPPSVGGTAAPQGAMVVRVTAAARAADGSLFTRAATLRLTDNAGPGVVPIRVIRWDGGG